MTTATRNAESGSHAASSSRRSALDLGKTLLKLAPRQIQDEVQIALLELKKKGIGVGVAAGLFGAALVFVTFMVTSLIVAMIAGIAGVGHMAVVALFVALGFLVIAAILALIGLGRLKKSLPLKPNRAIHGLRHDLGVLKDGRRFDERSLLDTRTKEQREADAKRAAEEKQAKARQEKIDKGIDPDAKPLTLEQLISITSQRRANLAETRDDFVEDVPGLKKAVDGDAASGRGTSAPRRGAQGGPSKADELRATASRKLETAKVVAASRFEQAKAVAEEKRQAFAERKPASAVGVHGETGRAGSPERAGAVEGGSMADRLKERKGAVATAGASLSAFAILANKLSNRSK